MSDTGNTPLDHGDNLIAGVDDRDFLHAEWDGPADYAQVQIPDERKRPKPDWSADERRAYILRLLREYGTPQNLPMSQSDIAEAFNLHRQTISGDMKVLREYIASVAGTRTVARTDMIAHKAVEDLIDEDPYKALQAQLEYNDWLFEAGILNRAPDKSEVKQEVISASASDELTEEQRKQFEKLRESMTGDGTSESEDVIDIGPADDSDDDE